MQKAIFFILYVLVAIFGRCEALRRIPGEDFILHWLMAVLVVLGLTLLGLWWLYVRRARRVMERIREKSVTHMQMPHLFGLTGRVQLRSWTNGYYLLRLYLQGIVRYEYVQPEGEEAGGGQLRIDEQRLQEVKDKGGRRSKTAIGMVKYIRDKDNCSIKDVLINGFPRDAKFVADADMEDTYEGEEQELCKLEKQSGSVLAGVAGVMWGIGQAKYILGLLNAKPSGYLIMILLGGFVLGRYLYYIALDALTVFYNTKLYKLVMEEYSKAPHDIDKALVEKVNTELPTDMERNRLLNAYFLQKLTDSDLLQYAAETPENTFMEQLARSIRDRISELSQRQFQPAENTNSGSSGSSGSSCSSCGSCGSCSSCSSCSSCGGCGGCGD